MIFQLPTKKDDAFRYLPLSKLGDQYLTKSGKLSVTGTSDLLTLEEALKTYGSFLRPRLENINDPFARLNLDSYQDSAFFYLPPNQTAELDATHQGQTRLHIFVGKNSKLKLHLSADGSDFLNSCFDYHLDDGAQMEVTSISDISGWGFTSTRATLKKGANFTSHALTRGGECTRDHYWVSLLGEESRASLNSLALTDGRRHAHNYVLMEHFAENTTSSQLFKNVLKENAHASFEGKIFVDRLAQKTEAYQMNKNLILGEFAQAASKPNLEIYADDVKAHGATFSQLSAEEFFYLKSRGLSRSCAQNLLLRGFCGEITEKMSNTEDILCKFI